MNLANHDSRMWVGQKVRKGGTNTVLADEIVVWNERNNSSHEDLRAQGAELLHSLGDPKITFNQDTALEKT